MSRIERLTWWGYCEDCGARYAIAPDTDGREPLPPTEDWENPFPSCFVCDGRVSIDGADPEGTVKM